MSHQRCLYFHWPKFVTQNRYIKLYLVKQCTVYFTTLQSALLHTSLHYILPYSTVYCNSIYYIILYIILYYTCILYYTVSVS